MTNSEEWAEGGSVCRWDWSNAEGRKALDAGGLRVLAAEDVGGVAECTRASVAAGLKIGDGEGALRAVGRSLGRLVEAGLALSRGERGKRTYRVSAKGRKMAEKGVGR